MKGKRQNRINTLFYFPLYLDRFKGSIFQIGACSSVRLERTPDKREVGGSTPPRPTTASKTRQRPETIKFTLSSFYKPVSILGGVAQLGERLPCTQEVIGSIPFTSTTIENRQRKLKNLKFSSSHQFLGLFLAKPLDNP